MPSYVSEVGGVHDLSAADVEAGLLGGGVDLLLAAHQDGGKEVAGQQAGTGLQDAGIGTLGKNDFPGVLLQGINELLEHMHGHGNYLRLN